MSFFDSKSKVSTESVIDSDNVSSAVVDTGNDSNNTKAINIETIEGLEQFLEAAEQVNSDASLFEADARDDDYKKLVATDIEGDKIFDFIQDKYRELRGLVDKCRYELIPNKQDIPDDDFERLQTIYNDMVYLRNLLIEAYSVAEEDVAVDTLENDDKSTTESKSNVVLNESASDGVKLTVESSDYEEDEDEGDADVDKKVESVAITETKLLTEPQHEAEFGEGVENTDLASNLAETKKRAQEILKKVDDIANELELLFPQSRRTEEVMVNLSELVVGKRRAEKLFEKLNSINVSSEAESALATALLKYQQIFTEIVKNAEAVKVVLLKKGEESKILEKEIEKREDVAHIKTNTPVSIRSNEKHDKDENKTSKSAPIINKPGFFKSVCDEEKTELGLPLSKRRCEMFVIPDTRGDGQVRIDVAEKAEEIVKDVKNKPTGFFAKMNFFNQMRTRVVASDISSTESSVVARTEEKDPINRVVTSTRPSALVTEPISFEISLAKKYLSEEPYWSFVKENFRSPEHFDRWLGVYIAQIDAKSIDALDRWLNEIRPSPFNYLCDMKLSEVDSLGNLNFDEVNSVIRKENIKYDSLVVWLDLFYEIRSYLEVESDIEFGELFTKWMVITEMEKTEDRDK